MGFGKLGFWSQLLFLMAVGESLVFQQDHLFNKHIGVGHSIPSSSLEQDPQPRLNIISCESLKLPPQPMKRDLVSLG